jgi:hypothetical protein
MNSDFITALRVQQHRADLERAAYEQRLARVARHGRAQAPAAGPAPARRQWWPWPRRRAVPVPTLDLRGTGTPAGL